MPQICVGIHGIFLLTANFEIITGNTKLHDAKTKKGIPVAPPVVKDNNSADRFADHCLSYF